MNVVVTEGCAESIEIFRAFGMASGCNELPFALAAVYVVKKVPACVGIEPVC